MPAPVNIPQPSRGMTVGVLGGGGIGAVVIYFLEAYYLPHPLPGAVAALLGSFITGAVAWFVKIVEHVVFTRYPKILPGDDNEQA